MLWGANVQYLKKCWFDSTCPFYRCWHWDPESSALYSSLFNSLEAKFLQFNRKCGRQYKLELNVESDCLRLYFSFIILSVSYCCVTNLKFQWLNQHLLLMSWGHSRISWFMLSTARWLCFSLQQLGQLCCLLQVCGLSGDCLQVTHPSCVSSLPRCFVLRVMLEI